MNSKQIRPTLGGFFKENDKIYLAKKASVPATCVGCCFYSRFPAHSECSGPDNLVCKDLIFEDVTDSVIEQVIESDKYGCFPLFSFLGAGAAAAAYAIYCLIVNMI